MNTEEIRVHLSIAITCSLDGKTWAEVASPEPGSSARDEDTVAAANPPRIVRL